MTYKLSNQWLVDDIISDMDAQYDTYENCNLLEGIESSSGNRMIYAPKYTATLGVDYIKPLSSDLKLFSTTNTIFSGDYY